jgi:hypothetical protein
MLNTAAAQQLDASIQNESVQGYVARVGIDAAKTYYKNEFIAKALELASLISEIDGDFDDEAISDLISKSQFLAIRANRYVECVGS